MTEQQKRFCEAYAANPNAAAAAREAGYSEKTAKSQGQRLLTKADILEYIRELQAHAEEQRISTMLDVKRFWSQIMNDTAARTADRLKASELLAKAAGAFTNAGHNDGETNDGQDVQIYLPEILPEEYFLYHGEDEAAAT